MHIIAILTLATVPIVIGYSVSQTESFRFPDLPEFNTTARVKKSTPRIAGGHEALDEQFPYQVGLAIRHADGTSWCGGSLIAKRWVLTAAHCLDMDSLMDVTVYLGVHNIYQTKEIGRQLIRVPAENCIVHADYNPNRSSDDIGLVKLTKDARISREIQIIPLPSEADVHKGFVNVMAVASGWGRDSDVAESISPVLRFVDLKIISNEECSFTFLTLVQSSNICTSGAGRKSPCRGDSGGPLVYSDGKRKILIGLTSFGSVLGCEVLFPAVFTRVTWYLDWIGKMTNNLQ